MKAIFRTVIVGAALAVAGCTSSNLPGANLGDTFFVEGFINEELPGGSYTQEQARAYQARAAFEAQEDTNWYDSTAFYRKGQIAASGQEVMPWDPAEFGLSGDIVTGYNQTVAAAAQYKDVRPEPCARMVALYDHWLEQTREGSHSITAPGVVQGQWAGAYFECTGGVATPPDAARYIVYFGFDRSDLDAQARGVLDDVVAAVSGLANPQLSIVGHTDTAGSKAYNQGLSERRAARVANYLASKGVSRDRMVTAGRSELELAVPTGDGVPEAGNRRVEVSITE
ncbi:MAG: OmpA family protein [Pseudomonadota bacterium]